MKSQWDNQRSWTLVHGQALKSLSTCPVCNSLRWMKCFLLLPFSHLAESIIHRDHVYSTLWFVIYTWRSCKRTSCELFPFLQDAEVQLQEHKDKLQEICHLLTQTENRLIGQQDMLTVPDNPADLQHCQAEHEVLDLFTSFKNYILFYEIEF